MCSSNLSRSFQACQLISSTSCCWASCQVWFDPTSQFWFWPQLPQSWDHRLPPPPPSACATWGAGAWLGAAGGGCPACAGTAVSAFGVGCPACAGTAASAFGAGCPACPGTAASAFGAGCPACPGTAASASGGGCPACAAFAGGCPACAGGCPACPGPAASAAWLVPGGAFGGGAPAARQGTTCGWPRFLAAAINTAAFMHSTNHSRKSTSGAPAGGNTDWAIQPIFNPMISYLGYPAHISIWSGFPANFS